MWFKNHLSDAAKYSRTKGGLWFYFVHMFWAIKFATLLFVWSLAMFAHAIVPQLVGFTVLAKLIEFIKEMKKQHPDDPMLKRIHFE
jgi:hypothetical protein